MVRRIGVSGVLAAGLVLGACGGSADGAGSGDGAASGDGATTTTAHDHADGDHAHDTDDAAAADGDDYDDDDGHGHESGGTATGSPHEHGGEVRLPRALPTLADGSLDPDGIDLSGVPGVTAEQQAAAEDLLVRTIRTLPKWADVNQAVADGFQTIGDSLTGEEHYMHWDWIDDDVIFDPEYPESLVYSVDPDGGRTLEAAMYMLPKSYTFDNLPDIGGALMQFHIHDDLCFTSGDATTGPRVAGLTSVGGECSPPLVKFHPNAMVHVWIRPNECGPFASLLGVGAGQIAPGAERSCVRPEGELTL